MLQIIYLFIVCILKLLDQIGSDRISLNVVNQIPQKGKYKKIKIKQLVFKQKKYKKTQ